MTPSEYRDILAALGLTQVGAARLLGACPRTGQYWAKDGPPRPVAMLLRLALRCRCSTDDLLSLIEKDAA
jgi:hypothetical protein